MGNTVPITCGENWCASATVTALRVIGMTVTQQGLTRPRVYSPTPRPVPQRMPTAALVAASSPSALRQGGPPCPR